MQANVYNEHVVSKYLIFLEKQDDAYDDDNDVSW